MHIKELTNEEFSIYVNVYAKTSLYQTTEYALTMSHQGYDSMLLGLVDQQNNVYGATLVLIQKVDGFKYAFAPRGFLIDYNNTELVQVFTKEIKKYLGKKDIIAVKISPLLEKSRYQLWQNTKSDQANYNQVMQTLQKNGYFHMGYNQAFEAMKPRFESVLKLNAPYYTLFDVLDPKLKEEIKEAEQMGVKIYKGNQNHLEYLYLEIKNSYPRDLNYLKQLYQYFSKNQAIEFYYAKLDTEAYLKRSQARYQEYETKSNELNQRLISETGNKEKIISEKMKIDTDFAQFKAQLVRATSLLREFPKGIILASSLMIKHKKEIYTILDSYNHKMKEFSARYLLMWKLIEKYAKAGYDTFNLGGITNPTLLNETYQEHNTFKTAFHGEVIEYAGDFELITNGPLYFMYRNTAPIKNMFK